MERSPNPPHTALFGPQLALIAIVALGVYAFGSGIQARASTATFVQPATLTPEALTGVSTAGDGAGVFLGLGETLALVFDQPFGVVRRQGVSIFTLPSDQGRAFFTFSFGSYNNGSPVIAFSRQRRAGRTLNINNPFGQGCSALGGCDYIEITLIRTARGSSGAEVDYVTVDGQVTTVTSPTPEPSAWALMIIGFVFTAWRLKQHRPEMMLYISSAKSLAAT